MGYRLTITDKETGKEFYGTKLYGYVVTDILSSYHYLISINKFNGNEVFDYSSENKIELSYEEFILFIMYYSLDLFVCRKTNIFTYLDFDILYNVITTYGSKILSWG